MTSFCGLCPTMCNIDCDGKEDGRYATEGCYGYYTCKNENYRRTIFVLVINS